MNSKKQIIQNFNAFIQEYVVPNKLEIIMKYDGATSINFDEIELIDIYFNNAETSNYSDGDKRYNTLVHVINLGEKTVELSVDEYNHFRGLYPLDDYSIYYNNHEGTELQSDEPEYADFGLHLYLNDFDYMNMIGNFELISKFKEHSLKEFASNFEDIKKCIPGVVAVKPLSFEKCTLDYGNNICLEVEINQLSNVIATLENKINEDN